MDNLLAPPEKGISIAGCDPGLSGAIAFLFPDGHVEVHDFPVVNGEIDAAALGRLIRSYSPRMACVEKASSRPGQGVSSTFKFGMAYGALLASLALCDVPCHLVSASKWKRHFSLTKDKELSRHLAIRMWPTAECFSRKGSHNRAEASLLAVYGGLSRQLTE